jgi:hypothetical protein
MNPPERRRLVDHADPSLSIVAQCRLLKIARSTLYYRPAAVSADDLALMRRMDELYLATPFSWVAADGGGFAKRWLAGEPQAGSASDARDGSRSDLPEAQHQPGASGA